MFSSAPKGSLIASWRLVAVFGLSTCANCRSPNERINEARDKNQNLYAARVDNGKENDKKRHPGPQMGDKMEHF